MDRVGGFAVGILVRAFVTEYSVGACEVVDASASVGGGLGRWSR